MVSTYGVPWYGQVFVRKPSVSHEAEGDSIRQYLYYNLRLYLN